MSSCLAGAHATDITPDRSLHLYGYPHVPRNSTGVHDPLLASALYLEGEGGVALFVSCDIIFIPKALAARARQRIATDTGVPAEAMVVTATHTHSGPGTVRYLSNTADPTVPEPDPVFLQQLEDGIVMAACTAYAKRQPAELGFALADGSCVGTNRRDPKGPADPRVPVILARDPHTRAPIGVMIACAMHPTVLHEDSTVISGDFPGLARQHLQQTLGVDCPVLHHLGAAGNQSPRHVIHATTLEEADRLGAALARSVATATDTMTFTDTVPISVTAATCTLPLKDFPPEDIAAERLEIARERFARLQEDAAPAADIRTAECDVFGAEEVLTLSRAVAQGDLVAYADTCMPADVQCLRIGPWRFIAFPGELFVEYALEIAAAHPDTFTLTLANGELQGYVVTEEAVAEGGYEASNALFKSPESGRILIDTALNLLRHSGT
jgi:hypothetical protein